MIVELALALISSAPLALAGGSSLPDTFVSACLDGKAVLSSGSARAVSVDELPSELRTRLGDPASGQAWRLDSINHSYLYVLNYEDPRSENARVCGLASDAMNRNQAADAVEERMMGYIGSERLEGMQWLMPKDGYVAVVTKAGRFSVAQINWLTDRGKAEFQRNVRRVTP
jgi:hypothetical protein